jgi:hypothetical protein
MTRVVSGRGSCRVLLAPIGAFFPLLPLLLRWGTDIWGSMRVVGSAISLAAALIAGYVLFLLARLDLDERAARTTVVLAAVFPTSLFSVRRGLVPVGVGAFCLYLGGTHGSPLAPFEAEHFWGRACSWPFDGRSARCWAPRVPRGHVLAGTQHIYAPGSPVGWDAYQLIELPFLALAMAGLWMCWRRLPLAYFAYALVLCCQALSYPTPDDPMESFSRYLLVMFPIFMGWGAWLSSRPLARRACGRLVAPPAI